MNLPVATVRDWLAGRLPHHSRPRDPDAPPACDQCGHPQHDFLRLPPRYVYLLGLYLGDGSISAYARRVYRLRITLDAKYPGIIAEAAAAMKEIRLARATVFKRRHQNCVDVSSYWKSWPCLFPQHGPGRKHDRQIRLHDWQRHLVQRSPDQLLRGLIHSDGCRFMNTGRADWRWPRYSFSQVSDDIRGLFCEACERMNVRWTRAGTRTIYVSRMADVALLDEFIGPKY